MNGFDDLERQLRGKVAAQPARRRRRLTRSLALAAALLASASAVTAAATGVIGGPGGEQHGAGLLNAVIRATEDVPVCRLRGPDRRPAQLSVLPASDRALRAFPRLRRPPTTAGRAAGRRFGRMAGMTQVLSGGARTLRAADGTRFELLITAGRGRGLGRDPGCFPVLRAELERRAPGVEPTVLAAARALLDRDEGAYRANLGREGLLFLQLREDGGLRSGGGTFSDIAIRKGTTTSTSSVRVRGRQHTTVAGLVPAGVDHVVVRRRGDHGRAIRLAAPEQVFHAVLPRGFANRVAVEWRARDGRLLRVVRLGL